MDLVCRCTVWPGIEGPGIKKTLPRGEYNTGRGSRLDMIALNNALVKAVQKHLVPQFPLQTEYKPWWWPKAPGCSAADWGLTDSQVSEYASLSKGAAKRSAGYEGFVGSVAATHGAAWLLSIRPSAGTFARSVGPLYTVMLNYANGYDGNLVPELHVTDLVKFRGPTAATSWTVGLTAAMLRTSLECLYDEYLATSPQIILLVDWAGAALRDNRSPLFKTSALRMEWRSDPRTAHLDTMLSTIEETGRPVPFWGQGNQGKFNSAFSNELQGYRRGNSRWS